MWIQNRTEQNRPNRQKPHSTPLTPSYLRGRRICRRAQREGATWIGSVAKWHLRERDPRIVLRTPLWTTLLTSLQTSSGASSGPPSGPASGLPPDHPADPFRTPSGPLWTPSLAPLRTPLRPPSTAQSYRFGGWGWGLGAPGLDGPSAPSGHCSKLQVWGLGLGDGCSWVGRA